MSSLIPVRLRPFLPALLLTLLVALLYGHTLYVPWYLDDRPAIVERASITDLGRSAVELFQPRGVANLTFALNYRLHGFSLPGFHLTNILIHLACGGIVLLLLRRIFRDDPFWPLCGALFFIAHPLQTQAVTYVVQRMTSLSALFFLLALFLFIRAREALQAGAVWRAPRHLTPYLGALVCAALALGTKENTVVLPLALLLFVRSFLPEERSWRPLLLAVTPFFLLSLCFTMQRVLVLADGDTSLLHLASTQPLAHLQGNSPLRYLLTELSVYWIYLRLLLLPYGQAIEHSYPVVKTFYSLQTLMAGFSLLLLGGIGWKLRHLRPRLTFAIAWFFLTLSVESSIIPLDPLFEHRLYLPLFGFVVALLDLATLIPRRQLAETIVILALCIGSMLTWQRNLLWNDPVALYEESRQRAPDNERTLINLSSEYIAIGKRAEAEQLALRALEVNPDCFYAYRNLGRIYLDRGQPDAAVHSLEKGLDHANTATLEEIYSLLAEAKMQLREPSQAIAWINKALEYREDPSTYNNLGAAYQALGRWAEAEASFRKALAMDSDNPLLHANLARQLRLVGRLEEALSEYERALRKLPQRIDLQDEAGQIRKLLGR